MQRSAMPCHATHNNTAPPLRRNPRKSAKGWWSCGSATISMGCWLEDPLPCELHRTNRVPFVLYRAPPKNIAIEQDTLLLMCGAGPNGKEAVCF
mmetsp:Transcript_19455/g.40072  ORF Transcript_19455/g.40072 Transcript_19455/m.40072 type:complete len:94 (-) Transcript_19455:1020-1301(-)